MKGRFCCHRTPEQCPWYTGFGQERWTDSVFLTRATEAIKLPARTHERAGQEGRRGRATVCMFFMFTAFARRLYQCNGLLGESVRCCRQKKQKHFRGSHEAYQRKNTERLQTAATEKAHRCDLLHEQCELFSGLTGGLDLYFPSLFSACLVMFCFFAPSPATSNDFWPVLLTYAQGYKGAMCCSIAGEVVSLLASGRTYRGRA